MKKRTVLGLGLLLGLSTCREADSTVLVSVSIGADVPAVYSLRVAMSTDQVRDTKIYPSSPSAAALPSAASFVIILPRARTGRLDLAVDGIDSAGISVAHGTGQTAIVVGGAASASVFLTGGPSLCGNGVVDPGEDCDDSNRFSFDGCDFRCQIEGTRPDAAISDGSAQEASRLDGTNADVRIDDVGPDRPSDPPAADTVLDLPLSFDVPRDLAHDVVDSPAVAHDGNATAIAADGNDGAADSATPSPDAAGYPPGQACTGKDQCASGNCVDGVCCQSRCGDPCMVCNLPTAMGQCSTVPSGSDPRDECSQDLPSTCGRDGTCDGAGNCRRWAKGTLCVAATCATAGSAAAARTCDGAGTCSAAVTTPCAPFVCKGNACGTTCSATSECASGASCQGTVCKAKLPLGTSCTSGEQCQSTYCTDGVCCGVASCTTPGNTCSTCSNSTNGVPNGQCGARCAICNCVSGNCSC